LTIAAVVRAAPAHGAAHPLRVYPALRRARHRYLRPVIPGRAVTTGAVPDHTLTCMEALLDGRA